jgi:uncharacterized protein (DUF58 family)
MTVHDLIAEVSSLFALAAARRDRVGAILFDDGLREVIPPRLGWRHGLRVVREVLGAVPTGAGTAFGAAVRGAGHLLRRRGVVIAVVDRSCPLPRRELLALSSRHEVVVVRATDLLGQNGIEGSRLPVVDAETGRPGVVRGRPVEVADVVPPGIDLIDLVTDTDYLPVVRAMLEKRERRVH